ncbi:hypothetical protein KJ359_001185 [Pestalotiopsis sp. 9143b]|nr:hypothetical protein KJ359_001185 [Pestalotiopsis sp. 9143b]
MSETRATKRARLIVEEDQASSPNPTTPSIAAPPVRRDQAKSIGTVDPGDSVDASLSTAAGGSNETRIPESSTQHDAGGDLRVSDPVSGLSRRSLGAAIEAFVKPSRQPPKYTRSLSNLFYMLKITRDEEAHDYQRFLKSLSRSQKHTLDLLKEWWTGRDADYELVFVKTLIFAYAIAFDDDDAGPPTVSWLKENAPDSDQDLLRDVWQNMEDGDEFISAALMSKVTEADDYPEDHEPIKDISSYHNALHHLFLTELCGEELDYENRLEFLKDASVIAAAERIAYTCLDYTIARLDTDKSGDTSSLSSEAGRKLRECVKCIPATVDACHWLTDQAPLHEPQGSRSGLPHYLWDIEKRCTVAVADIIDSPMRYGIISHTWGRWRQDNSVKVDGVPWLVPSLSRYDVRGIPQMIHDAGFPEPYVWIDLFCIPQEMATTWQAEICKQELPRQAAIFQNAATAVVWLSDIDDWSAIDPIISWLSLEYMSAHSMLEYDRAFDIASAREVIREQASSSDGLSISTIEKDGNVRQGPPGWFTSLWTLQEVMMRPDMILVDRNWLPLLAGDCLAIDMDSLAVLLSQSASGTWRMTVPEALPKGVEDFTIVMNSTGMSNLYYSGELTALIVGRTRVSTSSRAPAIMSVLGATKWFEGQELKQFQTQEEQDYMVCGLYPLVFVEEVRDRVGAAFFTCWNQPATWRTCVGGPGDEVQIVSLVGTMLPFMPISETQTQRGVYSKMTMRRLPDHPSIAGWEIHADGSVFLPEVGIMASTVANRTENYEIRPLSCIVLSNDPQDTTTMNAIFKEDVVLQDWISVKAGEAHAICTATNGFMVQGVILHRALAQGPYVKAGTFESLDTLERLPISIPPTTSSNWLVA